MERQASGPGRSAAALVPIALLLLTAVTSAQTCLEAEILQPRVLGALTPLADFHKLRMFDRGHVVVLGRGAAMMSLDSGESWSLLPIKPVSKRETYYASCFPNDSSAWIASGKGDLATTTDRGKTWSMVSTGLDTLINVQTAPGGGLYIQSGDQVLHRLDRGALLPKRISAGGKPGFPIHFNDSVSVYVANGNFHGDPRGCNLYRTIDAGANWETLVPSTSGYCVAEKESDTSAYILSGGFTFHTRDRGESWLKLPASPFEISRQAGYYFPDRYSANSLYLDSVFGMHAEAAGKVIRTGNGGASWRQVLPLWLRQGSYSSMAFHGDSSGLVEVLAVNPDRRLHFHTKDGGRTWALWDSVSGRGNLKLHPGPKGRFFGIGRDGWLNMRDSSSPWTRVASEIPNPIGSISFPGGGTLGFAAGGMNPNILGGQALLMRTTDAGSTWAPLSHDIRIPITKIQFVKANTGYAMVEGRIHKSTDGGNRWTELEASAGPLADFAFLATGLGMARNAGNDAFITRDGGETWTRIEEPLARYGEIFHVHVADEKNLYAITERGGIFHSWDGGKSWKSRLPAAPLNLATVNSDKAFYQFGTGNANQIVQRIEFGLCGPPTTSLREADVRRTWNAAKSLPRLRGSRMVIPSPRSGRWTDALGKEPDAP